MGEPADDKPESKPDELAPASRFVDTDDDIQIDPATLPENVELMRLLHECSSEPDPEYELIARDQGGALDVLTRSERWRRSRSR